MRVLRVNPLAVLLGLRTALGMVLATFIALFLHFKAPYWAAITVVAIMSLSHQASVGRGLQRIIGTMLGALLALLLVQWIPQNGVSFFITLFIVSFIGYYLFQTYKYQYAVILGLATFALVYASLVSGTDFPFHVAVWRVSEIVLGVIVTLFVSRFFTVRLSRDGGLVKEIKKSKFTLDKLILRQAFKTALSIELAIAVWLWTSWPGGIQGIISGLVISTKNELKAMRKQAWQRMLGCLLGGSVGLLCLHFLAFNIVILLILVFIIGAIFGYLTYDSFEHAYVGLQANVAFALTLIQAGGPTQSIAPGLERLSGIFLGIIATLLVNHLLWPLKERRASAS